MSEILSKSSRGFSFKKLLPAAAIISLFGIFSRIIGVIRDRLLTSEFGVGRETDAFLAAHRLPDLIYQLLVIGAVSSVFIPYFTKVELRDKNESRQLAANVLYITIAILTLCSVAVAIFANPIASILTAGFDDAGVALTAHLMRIQLIAPILLGASSICSSLLQTRGVFWTFATAPILYNLGQIIGITIFGNLWGIQGVSWGVVLGAAMHFAVQIPSYLSTRPKLLPGDILGNKDLANMLNQASPRIMALGASQINLLVETALASLLIGGSITVLTYGQNIMMFPLGAIGIPIAIAAFPKLSAHAAKSDNHLYQATLLKAARQTLFWIIPASIGLIVMRQELIISIFLSEGFSGSDAAQTASVLAVFSISLVTQALIPLYSRAFYAQHDTKRPVIAAIISIVINVILSSVFILILRYGVWSLALSFTISSVINYILHSFLLQKYIGNEWNSKLAKPFLRMVLASALMVLGVESLRVFITSLQSQPDIWIANATRLLSCSLTGAIIYLGIMAIFNKEEWQEVKNR